MMYTVFMDRANRWRWRLIYNVDGGPLEIVGASHTGFATADEARENINLVYRGFNGIRLERVKNEVDS